MFCRLLYNMVFKLCYIELLESIVMQHLKMYICLVQVGNGIELEAVGLQFESYRWRPCGVTWDLSQTVVVIKLRRTSALQPF